jgi:hypothetical protein
MTAFVDEKRDAFGVEPICRTLACRRPPTTSAPRASDRTARSRTSGCSSASSGCRRPTTTPTATGAPRKALGARRRPGGSRPRQAADARPRHPGRQAPRQAMAHHPPRPPRPAADQTSSSATSAPAHRPSCGSPTSAMCAAGKGWLLRLRAGRLQPHGRRLAARRAHAHQARAGRAADGALAARPRRRRRARAPLRPWQAGSNTPRSTTPRRWPTTACSPRSARSATPSTTRWPRASSTA